MSTSPSPFRSVVSTCVCIVVDEGHYNPGIPELVLNVLHVGRIWKQCIDSTAVFILRLKEDDRTTVCDLRFGDNLPNVLGVAEQSQSALKLEYRGPATRLTCLWRANSPVLLFGDTLDPLSQPGNPPPDASAFMYGPGRY